MIRRGVATTSNDTGVNNKAIYMRGSNRRNEDTVFKRKDDDDKPFFTSIVADPVRETFIKLHDPDCDIDKPKGHEMDEAEYCCEMFLYGEKAAILQDLLPIRWIDRRLCTFHHHPSYVVRNDMTQENGSYVIDQVEGQYDVMFPFPNQLEYPYDSPYDPKLAKQVRYLDSVFLMTKASANELFWATVCAVSGDGNVVAEAKSDVPSIRAKERDLVAFKVTQILLLKKGPNWSTETGGNDNKKRRGRRKGAEKKSVRRSRVFANIAKEIRRPSSS